ncbi:MAG: sigma-70 family RNA polymerase sigma factor [Balneolaceae bacterium]
MSATSGYSDRELVMKLQNGSRTAFEIIFNRYREKLLLYSLAIVKTDGDGKDIVQETFIRLWTSRQKLDSGKSLSGYLHTIARNLALNHLKRAGYDQDLRERIWKSIEEVQQRVAAEENLFARESTRLVQEAVAKLP